MSISGSPTRTRKIAVEEHFLTDYFLAYEDAIVNSFRPDFGRRRMHRISDLSELRLEDMDANGIDMQILSLTTPGIQAIIDGDEAVYRAQKTNDFLAEVVRAHPTRYAGFACLPCQKPDEAADELERAVTELGLRGALINGHTHGEYLDGQKFRVIWERAQSLGVPIYLHPGSSPDQWKVTEGYPELSKAMWGWGCETATHTLRLILSGLFDAYPNTTLILGHMGEMLPFFLSRLDNRWEVSRRSLESELKYRPSDYFRRNVMVTTSGVCSPEALLCTQLVVGVERILFAVDYPYESSEEACQFIESAPLNPLDREKICFLNAQRLLSLEKMN